MTLVRRGVTLLLLCACGTTGTGGTTEGAGSGEVCGTPPDPIVLQGACPLALVCPSIDRYGGGDECSGPLRDGASYSSAELCVLEHLSSGTPGKIVVEGVCGDYAEIITLSIVATGEALLVVESREPCDGCECGEERHLWGPLDGCGLAPLEVFSECLDATDAAGRVACMTPENWLRGCAPAEPRCVGR